MATQERINQALQELPNNKGLLEIVQQAAKEVKLNPTHVVRVAASALRLNPKLAQCTPASFVGGLIALEQVGLEPVAGRAYLLPFKNNRKTVTNGRETWISQMEVQALIGYKGYSDLFYRHESALSLEARSVHEKDKFDYEYGTQSYLRHKPVAGERGAAIYYYSLAKMKDGAVLFLVMSREECIEHGKKHSKVYDKKANSFFPGTPWADDEEAMCKKTVLLQLAKNLPLSIETQKALSIDETTRDYRPGIESALDLPDKTSWDEDVDPIDAIPLADNPTMPIAEAEKPQVGDINDKLSSATPKQQNDSLEPKNGQNGTSGQPYVCNGCAIMITKAEAEYSHKRYGGSFCRVCQRQQKAKQ